MAATAIRMRFLLPEEYVEKRQLFLRSYQFSRKRSAAERLQSSAVRVRRLIWVRLCSARRFPCLLWSRLRAIFSGGQRRRRRLFYLVASHTPRPCTGEFCSC